MQNLNQIRARHVLEFARDPHTDISGINKGEVIKKIPTIIMNNGLLGALAYAMESKKNPDGTQNKAWESVFTGITRHLASEDFIDPSCSTASDLLDFLVGEYASSTVLRNVTNETMAWLEFARRLVQRKDKP